MREACKPVEHADSVTSEAEGERVSATYLLGAGLTPEERAESSRRQGRFAKGELVFDEPALNQLRYRLRPDGALAGSWQSRDGATALDTAAVYGQGATETMLGRWMKSRKIRDRIILIGKGAHPDASGRARVTPGDIASDLNDSLRRLETDFIDIYLLHRDDPDVLVPGQVLATSGAAPATSVLAAPAPVTTHTLVTTTTEAHITNSAGAVKPQAQAAANAVVSNVPGADSITLGGTRASAVDPGGHPSGLAVDYMVLKDAALGDAIVAYHLAHWDELGVDYIIWEQRMLSSAGGGWKMMENRGSPTANHMDHPHVNYRG